MFAEISKVNKYIGKKRTVICNIDSVVLLVSCYIIFPGTSTINVRSINFQSKDPLYLKICKYEVSMS